MGRTEANAGQILSQFVLAPINNPSLNMNDSNDGNKDQMAGVTPEVRSDKRKPRMLLLLLSRLDDDND